ncbi:hypothetical protein [Cerasicoccus frondis]|uniref:hypothetical protein n=1 Tax=Cerasicoccus frondis TaxID=490090 RepID=UPI0028526F95|nr:hypothetical protein [Cerasicoccus frondis]
MSDISFKDVDFDLNVDPDTRKERDTREEWIVKCYQIIQRLSDIPVFRAVNEIEGMRGHINPLYDGGSFVRVTKRQDNTPPLSQFIVRSINEYRRGLGKPTTRAKYQDAIIGFEQRFGAKETSKIVGQASEDYFKKYGYTALDSLDEFLSQVLPKSYNNRPIRLRRCAYILVRSHIRNSRFQFNQVQAFLYALAGVIVDHEEFAITVLIDSDSKDVKELDRETRNRLESGFHTTKKVRDHFQFLLADIVEEGKSKGGIARTENASRNNGCYDKSKD